MLISPLARASRASCSSALKLTSTRFASSSTGIAGTPSPSVPVPQTTSSPVPIPTQSPNIPKVWSTGQNPKANAMSGPRFEQTAMELQPNPLSAMGLVQQDPIRMIDGRRATCDGGGGPLGHPKIFINLDKPGPKACGYCGIRFQQAHHHH